MQQTDTDLFGERVQLVKRPDAYPAPVGSGPRGKTCRSCEHLFRGKYGNAVASKCALMGAGGSGMLGGAATDISMNSPACRKYEPETSATGNLPHPIRVL